MLNPNLKIHIKATIISGLFNKEEAAIQSQVDEILDVLTQHQTGNFFRFRHLSFARQNVKSPAISVHITPDMTDKVEALYSWSLDMNAMRLAMNNYITTALNICINVAECKHIFPNHIQDILKDFPTTTNLLQEKNQQKIIAFRAGHAAEEQHMREQYMRNMVL